MDKQSYPILVSGDGVENDPRFTVGLIFEVIDVLERHGYPRPAEADYAHLHSGVFRLLYQLAG